MLDVDLQDISKRLGGVTALLRSVPGAVGVQVFGRSMKELFWSYVAD